MNFGYVGLMQFSGLKKVKVSSSCLGEKNLLLEVVASSV